MCNVNGEKVCKIADYGLAKRLDEPISGQRGTSGFIAREIREASSDETVAADGSADVFSMGIVLVKFITRSTHSGNFTPKHDGGSSEVLPNTPKASGEILNDLKTAVVAATGGEQFLLGRVWDVMTKTVCDTEC